MASIEMDKTAIIVSAVVASLGLLGAILGFIAEGTNPSGASLGLGIGAALLLLGDQIIISVVGGCFGCCCKKPGVIPPSETNRIIGIVCGVFSWISAAVALVLFLAVGILAVGTYASGGVLTLLAAALGVASFVLMRGQPAAANAAPNGSTTGDQQLPAGIAIGHPQFPPAAAKPNNEQLPASAGEPEIVVGHPQFPSAPAQVVPAVSQAQGYETHAPNQQFPLPASGKQS